LLSLSGEPHTAAITRSEDTMKTLYALAAGLALGACSTMGNSSGVSTSDVAALDQAAAAVSSSDSTYQTATSSMASPSDCTAAVQHYSAEVQPHVDRLGQMSGRMDAAMSAMGEMMGADIECGAAVMRQELQHHLAVACASTDMGANRGEASRHVTAMQGYADHMRMRADELGTMMGESGGMMSQGNGLMGGGGSMMDGGSVTPDGGSMMDGGWVTPDGGMMPFNHTMPGCTFVDGGFSPDAGP
jgi:hypothetical protein